MITQSIHPFIDDIRKELSELYNDSDNKATQLINTHHQWIDYAHCRYTAKQVAQSIFTNETFNKSIFKYDEKEIQQHAEQVL